MTLYFYIPKKNESLQLIQNYRKLNQYIIKNKTLLLLIRKVINKLKNATIFRLRNCRVLEQLNKDYGNC